MQQWELEAREEIRDVIASYNQFGDHGDLEAMAELFTADGVLELGESTRYTGPEEIRGMAGAVKDRLSSSAGTSSAVYLRHHVSSLQFELLTPDEARTRCYFLAITHRGVDHWGGYRDHFVRDVDGRWRFQHRRARTDGRAETSAL